MDYSHGSSSATPTRVHKYQHLPPGVWTSNPSLAPVLPPQPGLTRYTASSPQAPPLQLQHHLHSSQSQLNLPAGPQDDMVQRMDISDDPTRHGTQVDGHETVTARVFSEYAPVSNNFIQSAPTVSASHSPLQDVSDPGHGSLHMLTARVYSDLPPSGHQVKRTNSRTVHDYVPSILGGGGVSQQGGPLERGVPTTQAKDPNSRWTRQQQPVPGQLPAGVSRNGGARGIYLRRSPSEAAVYASIPIVTSQVNDNHYDNYVYGAAAASSQPTMMAARPVQRSHSNVSSAPQHRAQTNQVTAYSTSDIYAIPNKVPRHTQNATQQEILEETSSITIMGSGGAGDSPPPPPPPPTPAPTTKATTLQAGQVHRTVRGTASLTLGPEEEEDYEDIEGEAGDQREEAKPAAEQQEEEALEADAEVEEEERLEAEVLEEHAALPPGVQMENPPGGVEVPGGLKGPDLTRHLPEFDNTGKHIADEAFRFLDELDDGDEASR